MVREFHVARNQLAIAQVSFTGGELSPHLHDRIDVEAYFSGVAHMDNFIPLPHGPILRRRGTRFITESAGSVARLVSFSFNINQTFTLEFTPNKMRIFYEDGIVVDSSGNPYELPTYFTAESLPKLNWAQHADWLYIVDGINPPQVLKRYGNTNWTIGDVAFTDPPDEWETGNYPSVVALFQQRAYYGATPQQPQQIWASRTGLYEEFTYSTSGGEVFDDHAFTYTIFSDDANGIQWFLPMDSLIVGTSGAEYKVQSLSSIDPITPKNIDINDQTHYGSAPVRPVKIGTDVIFAQRSRNRIRSFEYSFSEDQYTAKDLTIFASHILKGKIVEMAVQSAPDSYIWIVTDAGELIGCTYEKDQRVLAWHRHITAGKVKNICILPTRNNDVIYLVVERVINGVTKYFVEFLEDAWDETETVEESFYVDCGSTYRGPETKTISGLDYLEGETVSVLVDGWIHSNVVVSGGIINLKDGGSVIHVGIPYESFIRTMVPQSSQNLTLGTTRQIYSAIVAVENSTDFEFKVSTSEEWQLEHDSPTKIMNKAKPLTSRHAELVIAGASNTNQQLEIRQTKPHPLIIRGIVFKVNPATTTG